MTFLYFAYGSNMFTPKMKVAAPSAEFRLVGRLPGYVLHFNKHSEDGSGKGTIVVSGNPEVEVRGVIFDIDDVDREGLDRSEGGYRPTDVSVTTSDGPLLALTYIARADRIDTTLKPYTWYKEFVVRGAREHDLPLVYIEALEAVEAIADPDKGRDHRNRA